MSRVASLSRGRPGAQRLLQLAAQCPTRYACSDWTLLYSTQLHGFSLLTLHRRASACGPCVLVLRARGKDDVRRTFGFVASEWRPPQEPNHFYGTGETFVWQLERLANLPPLLDGSGEPPPDEVLHTYRWSGRNSHFCFSAREHLAVGTMRLAVTTIIISLSIATNRGSLVLAATCHRGASRL